VHETEGALVVRAERPAEVLAQIATLSSIGRWALEPRPPQAIEDVYFDDERRSLGRRRIALRIRRVDAVVLLTMKSPLGREGGVTTRTEVEAPWSADALRRVVAELDLGSAGAWAPSPEPALRELGLAPVQRRTTARERRAVVGDGREIAELALDTVTYDLAPGTLLLCEVEVEAKAPDADVGPILDALAARFETLAPWRHGKLATGFAAERAMQAGSLAPGTLTPPALDALERALG
jgi:inorganic triphosphatase YgiF